MKPHTIKVHFATTYDSHATKRTHLYSRIGYLVVTRELDPASLTKYNITHTNSGYVVARFYKLAHAFAAIKLLLPLTDWKQGSAALRYNIDLLQRVRDISEQVGGKVTTCN